MSSGKSSCDHEVPHVSVLCSLSLSVRVTRACTGGKCSFMFSAFQLVSEAELLSHVNVTVHAS